MAEACMHRTLLGMLTPSSNTVLEPYTAAILAGLLPAVTAHFQRFRVTRIGLSDDALAQFDPEALLAAARLLADARVDAIAWNGTSAGWLGFEADRRLCAAITAATGIAATTSVLAINEALAVLGARRIGLVTPYTPDVQARIIANYRGAGFEVVSETHLDEADNFAFSSFNEGIIARGLRAAAAARPDALLILCTNLRGAPAVERMERELGMPVLDSVAVTVWKTLHMTGVDPARIRGWGSLFQARPAS
jgi:maleate isomerase